MSNKIGNRRSRHIKLAVNYSEVSAELLELGKVDFDIFKCPHGDGILGASLLSAAERLCPIYVHFDGWAGHGYIESELLYAMQKHMDAGRCSFVNTHLGPTATLPSGITDTRRWALEQVGVDYQKLCNRFGSSKILLENVPWEHRTGFPFHRIAADPWLLNSVLDRWGGGLLLDLAHARIVSEELKLDVFEYVQKYPTERLKELHIAGLGCDDEGRRRDSMAMSETDWQILEWALDQISDCKWATPDIIAFEYGGVGDHFRWRTDKTVLKAQIPRIAELLKMRGLR